MSVLHIREGSIRQMPALTFFLFGASSVDGVCALLADKG